MQDRYTGDIGDFGKLGLLRWLAQPDSGTTVRLGVHWYLTLPEDNNDGEHRRYLDDPAQYRLCDAPLFDFLQRIRRAEVARPGELAREVAMLDASGLLPDGTRFFRDCLTPDGPHRAGSTAAKERLARRTDLHLRAVERLQEAELVFVDPDNGIERKSRCHHKKGPKYVYLSELESFIDRGQSVLVYQHATRDKGGVELHAQKLMETLKTYFGDRIGIPYSLHFRPARFFVLLPVGKPGHRLRRRMRELPGDAEWGMHFTAIASA